METYNIDYSDNIESPGKINTPNTRINIRDDIVDKIGTLPQSNNSVRQHTMNPSVTKLDQQKSDFSVHDVLPLSDDSMGQGATNINIHNPNGDVSSNATIVDANKYDMFRTKYKIEPTPIGKGSFATVYRAINENREPVAIKKIKIANLRKDRINKFMLELDISYEMKHNNIVKCHEIFKTKNHWYIVLEYCNGPSFTEIIKQLQVLDYRRRELAVKKFMIQLKNALQYIKTKNVIHRDLKPDNILLQTTNDKDQDVLKDNDGSFKPEHYTVKLADFGFARYLDVDQQLFENESVDMHMTICGTPLYMAPEMLINYKSSLKADLWSFGIIMFEALYGYNPFVVPRLDMKMLTEMIKKTKVKYDPYFSAQAIDLLKRLLVVEPMNRISWNDFFNHEWLTEHVQKTIKKSTIQLDDSYDPFSSSFAESFFDKCSVSTVNNLIEKIDDAIRPEADDDFDINSDNTNVSKSIAYSKPINIPPRISRPRSYASSAPQPPRHNVKKYDKSKMTNIDLTEPDITEHAKTFAGYQYKRSKLGYSHDDDNDNDDNDDEFVVITEEDQIAHSEELYNQARERRNSFKSYESITGSVIRIVSSPINFLMKSISSS